jgi:hypothetical protein
MSIIASFGEIQCPSDLAKALRYIVDDVFEDEAIINEFDRFGFTVRFNGEPGVELTVTVRKADDDNQVEIIDDEDQAVLSAFHRSPLTAAGVVKVLEENLSDEVVAEIIAAIEEAKAANQKPRKAAAKKPA